MNIASGDVQPIAADLGIGVSALGYNTLDNYLYGMDADLNAIVRINAQGVVTQVTGEDSVGVNMGEIDTNGYFWIAQNGVDWFQVDLLPGSPTYGAYVASGHADTLGYIITDWVQLSAYPNYLFAVGVNPTTPGGPRTALLFFGKISGTWTVYWDAETNPGTTSWGAMYAFDFDSSYVYATGDPTGDIWRFPVDGSEPITLVSESTATTPNDGAACRVAPPPAVVS